ncbi:MAG: D-glycero-beta-D-manno-heptose 1-phosphate adenylyltransferase [bacterium]
MSKVYTWDEAKLYCDRLAKSSKKVVFSNGCFDVLHVGHVRYLNEARACGDFLLLALNSDGSVKRLKGNSRPFFSVEDRAEVLLALRSVDAVVVFEQDTPLDLLEYLRPPVYVKGGDYEVQSLLEYPLVSAYGGEVRCLSFYEGYSSSSIIDRV